MFNTLLMYEINDLNAGVIFKNRFMEIYIRFCGFTPFYEYIR